MLAASAYKLLKTYDLFTTEDIKLLAIGNIVAFVVAMIAIKGFIAFLTRYGFRAFGVYRIIAGAVLITLLLSGISLTI
jgi:undecaprenyl-diphosphatase